MSTLNSASSDNLGDTGRSSSNVDSESVSMEIDSEETLFKQPTDKKRNALTSKTKTKSAKKNLTFLAQSM